LIIYFHPLLSSFFSKLLPWSRLFLAATKRSRETDDDEKENILSEDSCLLSAICMRFVLERSACLCRPVAAFYLLRACTTRLPIMPSHLMTSSSSNAKYVPCFCSSWRRSSPSGSISSAWVIQSRYPRKSSSICCFSRSLWKSPRALAFSLSLENSLQK
jgi:hypothetical protein